ncbi:MAG: PAS domain-containing protein [Ferrovum sp.]|nr:PAS domain-containing protein [Ferrovum sp.]NDU87031.1 PAS domain-containing protein [Ferrovum sp.]
MKNKIIPTQVEKVMRENDFIVSTTDTKGRITYGNRIFVEFSGYSWQELVGAQHNIIRHPDMPRSVFNLLWEVIQAGHECNAYVKNLAKDGSFYWVFANVTPLFDPGGRIEGYFSVRRKPKVESVKVMAGIYRTLLEVEQQAGAREAIPAATKVLHQVLADKGVDYDEFIMSI